MWSFFCRVAGLKKNSLILLIILIQLVTQKIGQMCRQENTISLKLLSLNDNFGVDIALLNLVSKTHDIPLKTLQSNSHISCS